MSDRDIVPTRIALLDLIDERRLVREGYELLDEKRMLLAARILRALDELKRQTAAFHASWQEVQARLRAALAAHGLNDLEAWPPRTPTLVLERRGERVLGVEIGTASADLHPGELAWSPAALAPTIDACVEATQVLLARAVPLAALETTLTRLADEYVRTERRTRAVENVVLPELEADLRGVESSLEALDQEEVVRVHSRRT